MAGENSILRTTLRLQAMNDISVPNKTAAYNALHLCNTQCASSLQFCFLPKVAERTGWICCCSYQVHSGGGNCAENVASSTSCLLSGVSCPWEVCAAVSCWSRLLLGLVGVSDESLFLFFLSWFLLRPKSFFRTDCFSPATRKQELQFCVSHTGMEVQCSGDVGQCLACGGVILALFKSTKQREQLNSTHPLFLDHKCNANCFVDRAKTDNRIFVGQRPFQTWRWSNQTSVLDICWNIFQACALWRPRVKQVKGETGAYSSVCGTNQNACHTKQMHQRERFLHLWNSDTNRKASDWDGFGELSNAACTINLTLSIKHIAKYGSEKYPPHRTTQKFHRQYKLPKIQVLCPRKDIGYCCAPHSAFCHKSHSVVRKCTFHKAWHGNHWSKMPDHQRLNFRKYF